MIPDRPVADWHAAVAKQIAVRELAAEYNERAAGNMESDEPLATVLRDPEGPFKVTDKIEAYYAPEAQEQLASDACGKEEAR